MSIRFRCPTCQSVLRASNDRSGSIVDCPRCRSRMQVPEAAPPIVTVSQRTQGDPFPLIANQRLRPRRAAKIAFVSVGIMSFLFAVLGLVFVRLLYLEYTDKAASAVFPMADPATVRLVDAKATSNAGSTDNEKPKIPTVIDYLRGELPIRLVPVDIPTATLTLRTYELYSATNEHVTVNNILYNGTYEPSIRAHPGTLCLIGWPKKSAYSAFNFEHTINFIDIHTSKGSFRFDSNGIPIGRNIGQPKVDTKTLTKLEDAKIETLEKEIVAARQAMFATGDTSNPLLKKHSHSLERFGAQPNASVPAGRPLQDRPKNAPRPPLDFSAENRALLDRVKNAPQGRQVPPGGPDDE